MIECHGTGTKVGDLIETAAVARLFGEYGIYIGSIKPNLGHSEGASGFSSVIKMVLALEKKTIPPNILFNTPNPNIRFEKSKLIVPIEPMPWPVDRCERVGVSFGIGRSNAHNLQHHTHHDMAHSLAEKREVLSHRAYCVVDDSESFEPSKTSKPKPNSKPHLIFTFTGQGAQWARMASIARLDEVLRTLPNPPRWTLNNEFVAFNKTSRLSNAEFSQPCCTALQIALIDLLVTHSSGEIAAAYACGAMTAADAIKIAYFRGQVVHELRHNLTGGMAAIGLVSIGCENSPESVTLTGDRAVLESVTEKIRRAHPDTLVRMLQVDCAYHSRKLSISLKHHSLTICKII
ncbi:hypothetical protein N431DRAFT_491346 [Stipitochalara longipes BDJ]|nr:hypothetical protein N431DRAFT_491346 [Stipitochalara longipes BDJ]